MYGYSKTGTHRGEAQSYVSCTSREVGDKRDRGSGVGACEGEGRETHHNGDHARKHVDELEHSKPVEVIEKVGVIAAKPSTTRTIREKEDEDAWRSHITLASHLGYFRRKENR